MLGGAPALSAEMSTAVKSVRKSCLCWSVHIARLGIEQVTRLYIAVISIVKPLLIIISAAALNTIEIKSAVKSSVAVAGSVFDYYILSAVIGDCVNKIVACNAKRHHLRSLIDDSKRSLARLLTVLLSSPRILPKR